MNLLTQDTAREVYAAAGRRFVHHYLSHAQLHAQAQEIQAGELANIQTAMSICRQYQWWEKLAEFCDAIRFTMLDKGYWIEYRGWLEAVLQQPALITEIDHSLILTLLDDYASLIFTQGEPDTAVAIYGRIMAMAGDQDHLVRAYAHYGLGLSYFVAGRLAEAEEQWRQASDAAERAGHSDLGAITGFLLSTQNQGQNLPDVAIDVPDNVNPDLKRQKEYMETQFRAHRHLFKNELELAEESFTRVCHIATQLDDQGGLALNLYHLGEIARVTDRPDLALDYYLRAEAIAHKLGNKIGLISLYSGMARLYLSLGNYAEARPYLEEGVRLERQFANRKLLAELLFMLGYARANTGSLDESTASFQEAERLFAEVEPERMAAAARALRRLEEVRLTDR